MNNKLPIPEMKYLSHEYDTGYEFINDFKEKSRGHYLYSSWHYDNFFRALEVNDKLVAMLELEAVCKQIQEQSQTAQQALIDYKTELMEHYL